MVLNVGQLRNMLEKWEGQMRILRRMSDNTVKDGIKNECISKKFEVVRVRWKR